MYAYRSAIRTLALLAAAAAAGCSEGGPTPPEEQVPALIAVVAGSGQVAEVGAALAQPLVVQVRAAGGEPVAGVTVEWSSLLSGKADPESSVTDADGRASTRYTLATTAGVDSVTAKVRGLPLSARLGVRGMPGPATQIRALPDSVVTYWFSGWTNLQAVAADRYGNPLPELAITWMALEPQFATVEPLGGGNARIDPAYPGRARVVAQAGPLADTVVVRVIHDITHVEVMPFRLRAMVGDSIVFTAIGRNPAGWVRWPPVSWSVEGTAMTLAVVDSARAVGRMVAPGMVTVEAVVGWEPLVVGMVQIEGVTSSGLASVSAGEIHNCSLTSAGKAYCWGQNFNEFTGTDVADGCPFAPCNTTPMPLRAGLAFTSLYTGHMATCGITADGPTWCWGHNYSGQLGTGTSSQLTIREPELVAGGHRFTRLAMGASHSCGLDGQGTAYCWGGNSWGELGTGTGKEHHAPAPVAGGHRWKQLAAGNNRTCGITTADEAFCWGAWLGGVPARVPQAPVFTALTVGWDHQCGLAADGQAYCWGLSRDGALGRGGTQLDGDSVPRPVVGGRRFVAIDAGESFTCALDAAGAAYCWGSDQDGELGNGGADAHSGVPTRVAGGHVFRAISGGRDHACAATGDGSVFCWGSGYIGVLGNGSREDSPVPARVSAVP